MGDRRAWLMIQTHPVMTLHNVWAAQRVDRGAVLPGLRRNAMSATSASSKTTFLRGSVPNGVHYECIMRCLIQVWVDSAGAKP